MRFWLRKLLSLALGMMIALGAGTVWLTVLEREHQVYQRFVRVDDLNTVYPAYPSNSQEMLFADRFTGDDPVEILEQVRDAVTCVATSPPTEDPPALLEHVDQGGGLDCAGIAGIYRAALAANGFDARITVASRFLTDPYDTHVLVEVREGDRWVIYDPTFGIVFERDGRRLGAQDVKQEFLDGGLRGVETVLVDQAAAYPARLDDYYMDWPALFSNVVVRDPAVSTWEKLPIIRWWLGERRYYEVTEGHFGRNVDFLNAVYWAAAVLFPTFFLVLLILILALGVYFWRVPERQAVG